jgi:predicted NUDIX family phosphoesterase
MPENEIHLEEHVLVVPRTLLEKAGIFQGLQYKMEGYSDILTDPKHHSFRRRKEVETDPAFSGINTTLRQLLARCGRTYIDIRRESSRHHVRRRVAP